MFVSCCSRGVGPPLELQQTSRDVAGISGVASCGGDLRVPLDLQQAIRPPLELQWGTRGSS